MKKFCFMALALVLTLSLCACGGRGNEDTTATTTQTQVTTMPTILPMPSTNATLEPSIPDDSVPFGTDMPGTGSTTGPIQSGKGMLVG